MPGIGFCENVFCPFPRDYNESDHQVVPWTLLLALFEDGYDVYCFPDIKGSPRQHVLSHMVWRIPAVALASSSNTFGCVLSDILREKLSCLPILQRLS